MTTKNKNKLTDTYLEFTVEEFERGVLTSRNYYKTLLEISSEYLSRNGDEEGCLKTLSLVSESFIKDELFSLMKEDGDFARSMLELAHHLERQGITWEGIIEPTQKGAEA